MNQVFAFAGMPCLQSALICKLVLEGLFFWLYKLLPSKKDKLSPGLSWLMDGYYWVRTTIPKQINSHSTILKRAHGILALIYQVIFKSPSLSL
ncbi:MAG: hypothetical protein KAT48_06890, partial [Bacteroidales bacterium]|nr:hypothetical protein [Bacteroidales bacterium]